MESEMDKTTRPEPFGEGKEEKPIQINEWLFELQNGNLVAKTKQGTFEFEDLPYEKIMAVQKRATRTNEDGNQIIDVGNMELMLMSDSLVKPKMGELDIKKLKGSTVTKLRAVVYKLYDLKSFLSI